jgi:hypothetical protein
MAGKGFKTGRYPRRRTPTKKWPGKIKPIKIADMPYDPEQFRTEHVVQVIANENDLDFDLATKVYNYILRNDPDELEPLAPISVRRDGTDEGWTIPVPSPEIIEEALESIRD